MKICCIGAGAIGLYIGGSLAYHGEDIIFLDRPGQESLYANKPISVEVDGFARETRNFTMISSLDDLKGVELDSMFITVKAFDTQAVIDRIKKAGLIPKSLTSFQNGVENESLLLQAFPGAEIIGASVVSAVSRLGDTAVRVEKNRGVGISCKGSTTEALLDSFHRSGFKPKRYADLNSMKWSKMISNLFANATSAILEMTPAEVYQNQQMFRIERMQILEALDVMQASGYKVVDLPGLPLRLLVALFKVLPEGLLQPVLTKLIAGGRGEKMPSFFIEKQRGSGQSEIDFLNGAIVRRGKTCGVPTPVNAALTRVLLQAIEDEENGRSYIHNPELLWETVKPRSTYIY